MTYGIYNDYAGDGGFGGYGDYSGYNAVGYNGAYLLVDQQKSSPSQQVLYWSDTTPLASGGVQADELVVTGSRNTDATASFLNDLGWGQFGVAVNTAADVGGVMASGIASFIGLYGQAVYDMVTDQDQSLDQIHNFEALSANNFDTTTNSYITKTVPIGGSGITQSMATSVATDTATQQVLQTVGEGAVPNPIIDAIAAAAGSIASALFGDSGGGGAQPQAQAQAAPATPSGQGGGMDLETVDLSALPGNAGHVFVTQQTVRLNDVNDPSAGVKMHGFGFTMQKSPGAQDPTSGPVVTPVVQMLNLIPLLDAVGYSGSNAIADGYITYQANASGGTDIYFDPTGHHATTTLIATTAVAANKITWSNGHLGWLSAAQVTGSRSDLTASNGNQIVVGDSGNGSVVGGSGDDILVGDTQGGETLSGGAGDDLFVLPTQPWAYDVITDFVAGHDKVDLSGVLQQIGYTGTDPIADGHIKLISDGNGGTMVYVDRDPANDQWGEYMLGIRGVPPSALTWSDLSGHGKIYNGSVGDSLNGTSGSDTINAAQRGNETITTGSGSDFIVFGQQPWAYDVINDFHVGEDEIDLSAVLRQIGYTGSNPVADGHIKIIDDGSGGSYVFLDRDPANNPYGELMLQLKNVPASTLTWADLSGQRPG